MSTPESPVPPRSPGFYLFRSNSSIRPPQSAPATDSLVADILPHLFRRIMRLVAAIVLPIILLPIHFFFLVLSILTTVLAGAFLSWRAFVVYLEIGMDALGRIYTDIFKGR